MLRGLDNGLFVYINIAAARAIHTIPHGVDENDPMAVNAIEFTQLRCSVCR